MPYAHVLTSFVGLQSYEVVRWKRHHKSWIELWLEDQRNIYRCSRCGKEFPRYYDRPWGRLRDLDPTVAAFSLIGMILWLPRWFRPGGRLTTEQAANEIAEMALGGLLKPAEDHRRGRPETGVPAARTLRRGVENR